jgi:hypothetical protein
MEFVFYTGQNFLTLISKDLEPMFSFTSFVCQPMNVPLALVEKRVFFGGNFCHLATGRKGLRVIKWIFFWKERLKVFGAFFLKSPEFD